MLRDVLTSRIGFHTWPCDEINYIWRHGNRDWPTDEFPAAFATNHVKEFICDQFDRIARAQSCSNDEFTVEKTCANSLRVPFIDSILPNAHYIHIVRDGRNVVASALQRWQAPLNVPYLIAKARYVPKSDLPYYATRYLRNRLHKSTSGNGMLSTWGPKFDGMDNLPLDTPIEVVCAMQWRRCIDLASAGFENIDPTRVHSLRYEEFIADPINALQAIDQFLQIDRSDADRNAATSEVRVKALDQQLIANLEPDTVLELRPALDRLGYE